MWAEVFRAEADGAEGFSKTVAIKRIRSSVASDGNAVDSFVSEAELARRLTHGNIVQIYDVGVEGGLPYLVMELVDGTSLSELLATTGPLPVSDALYIVDQVCAALDYAHHLTDDAGRPAGVIHRDVNPRNILLSRDGVVKLTDFGIAKLLRGGTATVPGLIKGTLGYFSPEQILGDGAIVASDQFSVGVVLYETLHGQNPLLEADDLDEYSRRLAEGVPRLKTTDELDPARTIKPGRPDDVIDEELADIVARAVHCEPGERYSSVADLRAELERWRVVRGLRLSPQGVRKLVRRSLGVVDTGRVHSLDNALADRLDAEKAPRTRMAVTADLPGPSWGKRIAIAFLALFGAAAVSYLIFGFALRSDDKTASASDVAQPGDTATPSGERASSPAPNFIRPPAKNDAKSLPTAVDQSTAKQADTRPATESDTANGRTGKQLEAERKAAKRAARRAAKSAKSTGRNRRTSAPAKSSKARQNGKNGTDSGRVEAGPPGRVKVNLLPWANVSIDGKDVGRTPVNVELPPGPHRIVLENPSFGKRVRTIVVKSNKVVTIKSW